MNLLRHDMLAHRALSWFITMFYFKSLVSGVHLRQVFNYNAVHVRQEVYNYNAVHVRHEIFHYNALGMLAMKYFHI